MTWDDLEMVNLRQTTDGKWSYTAYRKPFAMWLSNRGLEDVFACVEQITVELAKEPVASGGMGTEPAAAEARPRVKIRLSGEAAAVARHVKRRPKGG